MVSASITAAEIWEDGPLAFTSPNSLRSNRGKWMTDDGYCRDAKQKTSVVTNQHLALGSKAVPTKLQSHVSNLYRRFNRKIRSYVTFWWVKNELSRSWVQFQIEEPNIQRNAERMKAKYREDLTFCARIRESQATKVCHLARNTLFQSAMQLEGCAKLLKYDPHVTVEVVTLISLSLEPRGPYQNMNVVVVTT